MRRLTSTDARAMKLHRLAAAFGFAPALLLPAMATAQTPPTYNAGGGITRAAAPVGVVLGGSNCFLGTGCAATVSDVSNAAFQGESAMTVGTTYTAGRSLKATCTAAGNVAVTYVEASTGVWAAQTGDNVFPIAATAVNSSGTTATCTYRMMR